MKCCFFALNDWKELSSCIFDLTLSTCMRDSIVNWTFSFKNQEMLNMLDVSIFIIVTLFLPSLLLEHLLQECCLLLFCLRIKLSRSICLMLIGPIMLLHPQHFEVASIWIKPLTEIRISQFITKASLIQIWYYT